MHMLQFKKQSCLENISAAQHYSLKLCIYFLFMVQYTTCKHFRNVQTFISIPLLTKEVAHAHTSLPIIYFLDWTYIFYAPDFLASSPVPCLTDSRLYFVLDVRQSKLRLLATLFSSHIFNILIAVPTTVVLISQPVAYIYLRLYWRRKQNWTIRTQTSQQLLQSTE